LTHPHIGEFLDAELSKIGWDAHSLARDSGIRLEVIQGYLAGVGYMPRTHCRLIATSLKQPSGEWIRRVKDHDDGKKMAEIRESHVEKRKARIVALEAAEK